LEFINEFELFFVVSQKTDNCKIQLLVVVTFGKLKEK